MRIRIMLDGGLSEPQVSVLTNHTQLTAQILAVLGLTHEDLVWRGVNSDEVCAPPTNPDCPTLSYCDADIRTKWDELDDAAFERHNEMLRKAIEGV